MVCLSLRFPEALEYLEQGLALVNKLGDEKLAAYRWPGSQVIIEDTKPGKLLVIILSKYLEYIYKKMFWVAVLGKLHLFVTF